MKGKKSVLRRCTGQVLAVFDLLSTTSSGERSLRGASSHTCWCWVDNRDVDVAQHGTQGEANIRVLVIRVVHLKSGLKPGPAAGHLDDARKDLGDLVVTLISLQADVPEGVVGVIVHPLTTVAHRRHLLRRWMLRAHASRLHTSCIAK